jgi:trk system potassium uptake protein TrkA
MKCCIIGLGYFGRHLALSLSQLGAEVIAVDKREEAVNEVRDEVAFAAILDASNRQALERLPIADMDAVIVAIGEGFESSLLAVAHLQELGCRRLICRVVNPVHGKLLKLMHIEETILPEAMAAARVARTLTLEGVRDSIEVGQDFEIIEVAAPDFAGKTLKDLNLRERYRLNIITLKSPKSPDQPDEVLGVPDPGHVLKSTDILVLFGKESDVRRFLKR